MDPVQLRCILHLLHLLLRIKIKSGLRPINAGHRVCLQGHRRQRRDPLWPPLRLRHTQSFPTPPWAMGGPRGGCDPMLHRLFFHVGLRRWIDWSASRAVDVPIHVSGRSFSDFFQHRQCRQRLGKFSWLWWDHRWHHEGTCGFCFFTFQSIHS